MLTVWFSSDWILFLRILELTFGRPCTSGWQWRFGRARFWSGSGCCWAFPVPAAGSPDSRPARPHYSWSAGLTSGWWRRAWANSGPALQTLLSQRRCIILHNHISAIANISLSVFCAFLTRDLILVYLWLKTAAVFPGWWRILLPGYMLTPNGPLCVFNKVFRQRSRRNSGSNISITWKIWIMLCLRLISRLAYFFKYKRFIHMYLTF